MISNKVSEKGYRISEITTLRELDELYVFTHDVLVNAGYLQPLPGGRIFYEQELDICPTTSIVVAKNQHQILGTISIGIDNYLGLSTDRYFKSQTDMVREEGKCLVSTWRTMASDKLRSNRNLIMDLMAYALKTGIEKYRFDVCLSAVNPKHKDFYKLYFNAQEIGQMENMSHSKINAGAVLMRFDYNRIPQKVLNRIMN